jgi:hypothetical protein
MSPNDHQQPSVTVPQPPLSSPEGDKPERPKKWTADPAMFWVTLAGVVAVAVTLIYTVISSNSTDRKIDALVSSTSSLASAGWAQVGKGEKEVQAVNGLKDATSGLSQHTGGIETATADFAKAMRLQTTNTGQLVGVNKDSLTAVQRAFIVVDQLGSQNINIPTPDGKVIQKQVIFPIVQNSGNTPATISEAFFVTPGTDFTFTPNPVTVEPRLQTIGIIMRLGAPQDPSDIMIANQNAPQGILRNSVLGPKGVLQPALNAGAEILDTQAGMEAQTDRIGRFFYGVINYTDIFNVPHIEKYCFRIDGALIIGGGTATTPSRCTHWNCADDQCKADKTAYLADLEGVRKEVAEGKKRMQPILQPPTPKLPPSPK